jgi:hypothetical protein
MLFINDADSRLEKRVIVSARKEKNYSSTKNSSRNYMQN